MNNVLIVTSSAQAEQSISTKLARAFEAQLKAANPDAEIVRRDVGDEPIPHLLPTTIAGVRSEPVTEAEFEARRLSDVLVGELQAADLIVIAAPMYNFGMSSTLKTWFDHVLRARVTFRYTENGPEGLLKGRKAIVIESRGGLYSEGPAAVMDSQEPHIRTLLGFMGIEDVEFVRAEKLGFGPEALEEAVRGATERLGTLAEGELALAA